MNANANAATVQADEGRLRQVLVNLLTNGISYNRAGESVTVDACLVVDGMWRIDVTDAGIEGLGLGLVLCQSLVDMMGGRLEVASVASRARRSRCGWRRLTAGTVFRSP